MSDESYVTSRSKSSQPQAMLGTESSSGLSPNGARLLETFQFREWRRPYPWFMLFFIAVFFWGIGMGVCVAAGLKGPHIMVYAIALPVPVIFWILRKDHRRYPAGFLRLTPGEMEFTADFSGPMRIEAFEIRDLKIAEEILLIRMRTRPTLLIHQQRLESPLASVNQAIDAWMKATGSEASDTARQSTLRRQARENLRRKILLIAQVLGFFCGLALIVLKIFHH